MPFINNDLLAYISAQHTNVLQLAFVDLHQIITKPAILIATVQMSFKQTAQGVKHFIVPQTK